MRRIPLVSIGLLTFVALAAATGDAPQEKPPFQLPDTKRMAERLARIAVESDPTVNYMYSHKRAELILAEMKKTTNPKEVLGMRPRYANELLSAGKTQEAIDELLSVQTFVRDNGIDLGPRNRTFLRQSLGMAYLRLGEQ
ncbi:MAG TPA: hypothetical protein VFG76_03045, partial [Candidatus Polarisedimenticolia bacterium]|nr:hypothetical protein [Candidatus Polarisedimenticolia bacterium]